MRDNGINAAAKVIYDHNTDRRDPNYKPWEHASESDKTFAIKEAKLVIEEYLSATR